MASQDSDITLSLSQIEEEERKIQGCALEDSTVDRYDKKVAGYIKFLRKKLLTDEVLPLNRNHVQKYMTYVLLSSKAKGKPHTSFEPYKQIIILARTAIKMFPALKWTKKAKQQIEVSFNSSRALRKILTSKGRRKQPQ